MPNRIIRESWLESEPLNTLDAAAERFYLRLCLRADDFGRFHANHALLKNLLFPLKDDVRSADISRWLAACDKAGVVRCYEVDAKPYVEIQKFKQRTRAETSKFPAPVGQMTVKGPSNDGRPRTYSETETETYSETEAMSDQPPASPSVAYHDLIWDAYPHKVGKKKAYGIIVRLLEKNSQSFGAELLEKTQAYAAAVAQWPEEDRRFVPYPATWFGQERFNDDPTTWQRKGAKPALDPKYDKF